MGLPANTIIHYGLRKAAYPLDWVSTSLETTMAAITDGFTKLIDPANFTPDLTLRYTDSPDFLVHNNAYPGSGISFMHHNVNVPERFGIVKRSVQRWLDLEAEYKVKQIRILFVHLVFAQDSKRDFSCHDLLRAIESRFPTGLPSGSEIGLLFVEPIVVPNRDTCDIETVIDEDRLRYVKVTCSPVHGMTWIPNEQRERELWDFIFSRYKLRSESEPKVTDICFRPDLVVKV